MSASANVDQVTAVVYNLVRQVFDGGERAVVALDAGGVIVIAANGDHVRVLVQTIHFETGPELPF